MLAVPTKEAALARLKSMQSNLARIKEKGEAAAEKMIHGVEIVGGAAAVSYYIGKNSTQAVPVPQVMGYDVDLAAGVAFVAAGVLELAGKHSDHLFYLGAGAASAFATREALAKGQASRTGT